MVESMRPRGEAFLRIYILRIYRVGSRDDDIGAWGVASRITDLYNCAMMAFFFFYFGRMQEDSCVSEYDWYGMVGVMYVWLFRHMISQRTVAAKIEVLCARCTLCMHTCTISYALKLCELGSGLA